MTYQITGLRHWNYFQYLHATFHIDQNNIRWSGIDTERFMYYMKVAGLQVLRPTYHGLVPNF